MWYLARGPIYQGAQKSRKNREVFAAPGAFKASFFGVVATEGSEFSFEVEVEVLRRS